MISAVAAKQYIAAGAMLGKDGTTFRVWAPDRKVVQLVLVDPSGGELQKVRMTRDEAGYFITTLEGVVAGSLYHYQVDEDPKKYPDPASHFQPQGVHGPSQVIDHSAFQWTDDGWPGAGLSGQVIYELHLGTFTPEGTWKAAQTKLSHLREVGITLVEVMPIAAFPGEFGWGYDGVLWYAPTEQYGKPDDVRAFVDHAHSLGLGVILDVVYNHFGPCGNYAPVFSPYYFSDKHHTEWGEALNFDGENSLPVRQFICDNAAHWIRNFHFDGLRLDATHAIIDDSDEHIVAALTRAARKAAGTRSIVIFSEDERNRCQQVWPKNKGGWEIDGLWNDDFHHSSRVAATGYAEAYYGDYSGSPQELLSAIRFGYLYQGQWNARQRKVRGCPARGTAAKHFVHFLQNHDQVANSARGLRTHALTSPGRHRALTSLLLLGPETPMLFMGQEFSASAPFYYFADHEPDLARLVCKGRREFMSQFPRMASFEGECELVDPADESTFLQCKLDWSEVERNPEVLRLHRDLIRLRRDDPIISRQDAMAIEGAVIGPEALLLHWFDPSGDDRLGIFNLGRDFDWYPIAEPLLAPPTDRHWEVLWSSEEPSHGGMGTAQFNEKDWRAPGHAAVLFRAVS
jgi:maltooligosyltrehalose trehalohydrolase